jgi:serine/threonine-protein kinase
MPLNPGTRIGPYEIVAPIGAGGMGEVYRARDTRLKRDVAIKVLPESFAQHPDRLARFRREAELLASLNHANIAAIYGLEQEADLIGLVLEFVDGETLADQIARGPLARAEALPIARQIAEALEAAHDKGIVHRDLKPANVKVTPDGTVKVLDFGLAAVAQDGSASNVNATHSPTLTLAATRAGVILGTAAYMSPEQAAGKPVDKRADIWSFGVVLWELLTGHRLFDGETISHTLADVLRAEIDFTQVPPQTPAPVVELLRRCLDRDTKRRLRDIGEARLVLDRVTSTPDASSSIVAQTAHDRSQRAGRGMLWGLAVLAGALTIALASALVMWRPWRRAAPPSSIRLTAEIGAAASLGVSGPVLGTLALSPDGNLLAFAAQQPSGSSQLYIRRLDQLQAVGLGGTDSARSPFFSPDGQWIGFYADQRLKKISITGGAAVTICDTAAIRGASWGDNGMIVFTPSGAPGTALMAVSEAGGTPAPVTRLGKDEVTHRWPQTLPGGRAVLFTAPTAINNFDDANIVVQQLPNGPSKILQRGGTYGRYVPSGHLLYVHGGTLFAAPFDVDRLEITGRAVPVQEDVNTAGTGTGLANLAVSNNGTLVYLSGQTAVDESPIFWMDHSGRTTALRAMPTNWSNPRFSPDGTRLAMDISTAGGNPAIWIYDWARDTATRLTFGTSANLRPLWTPDGHRIAFTSTRSAGGNPDLYWQRSDGTGDAQRLTTGTGPHLAGSWHPDGKTLAFQEINPQTGGDILILTIEGDDATGWKPGKPVPFLNSPANESDPKFSPDGKWIAYQSNESGRAEVYVRPYPTSAGKWQISTGGGIDPIWSRTRPELLYSSPNREMMVAAYKTEGSSFIASKPQLWSPGHFTVRPRLSWYDLHPDGNRFALASAQGAPANLDKVVFVFNFFDELRRLAPATK